MGHYNELYALVSEMNTGIVDMLDARSTALSTSVTEPIPGELGTVTLSGSGELRSVDLDRDRIFGATGASLGAAVVRAITAAEQRAAEQYRNLVEAARPTIEL